MLSFIALSCLVGSILLALAIVRAPSHLALDCDRASSTCTMQPLWFWLSPRPFAASQLEDLLSLHTDHGALLAARRGHGYDHWSGEVSGTGGIAEVDAVEAAIRTYLEGDAPSMHVEVPAGSPMSPFALLFTFGFGLLIANGVSRTVMRTDVVLDDDARELRLVLHRWWRRNVRRTIRYDDVRGVRRVLTQTTRYRWVNVFLTLDDEPLRIVREYRTEASDVGSGAFAQQLAEAVGRPISWS